MARTRTLYGKDIVPHHMLTYAEQVYDILVGEIEQGRWTVGDRLPGVIALSRELGFGTKTIQSAYERLRNDGYIRALGYRGSFLQSLHPATTDGGRLGVLAAGDQASDPLILWYQHVIRQFARRKGLVADVVTRPHDGSLSEILRAGATFSPKTIGVISLTPIRMPTRFDDNPGTIPVVHLCPPFERCTPKVCADVRDACFDLTSRLIRWGHTRIAFSEDAVEPVSRQSAMHREGYCEAMQEHGLDVDADAIEDARRVRNTDPASLIRHLTRLVRRPKAGRTTAIVAGSLGRAMALLQAATLHGIDVPDNVSIVSIGTSYIEGSGGRQITGMLPDFDRMVDQCIAMLDEQRAKGRCELSEVHVRMHFVPGHTIKPLTTRPSPVASSEP